MNFQHDMLMCCRYKIVGDVRGKGLMIGVEMVEDKLTKVPLRSHAMMDIWDRTKKAGVLVGQLLLQNIIKSYKKTNLVPLQIQTKRRSPQYSIQYTPKLWIFHALASCNLLALHFTSIGSIIYLLDR
jgi:hypothetical protein